MKVFVTGGNGLIGSNVLRLLRSTNHEVRCLLRPGAKTARIDDQRVERVEGDVLDLASVERGIAGCDAAVHLACLSAWDQIDSPAVESVAVEGTRNVLKAAGNGVRVVHVSSIAAVGATRVPGLLNESTPFNLGGEPGLRYAQAKHRSEQLCREAASRGADVVIVNPAETFGPGDTALVTARTLIELLKRPFALVCDGGTSLAHVEDVAAGIGAALNRGKAGERYILGGENVSHYRLALLCLEIAGLRRPVFTVPRRLLPGSVKLAGRLGLRLPLSPALVPYITRYWFVENHKAVRELQVTFRSARETLQPTIAWLQAQGHIG
jgi:dihydroflavonol-4-reductase